MLEDTNRARKAIQMMRDNNRTSFMDFMLEFNIDENQAKLLYSSIITSIEL